MIDNLGNGLIDFAVVGTVEENKVFFSVKKVVSLIIFPVNATKLFVAVSMDINETSQNFHPD